MTTEKQLEKGISDIVGVFTDPILVCPGGWGDTLPDWIKGAITLERLMGNMKALKDEEMTGTDAEACAYLYTASLTASMDHDWTKIYLFVAGKVCRQHKQAEVPEDILVESLDAEQMRDLARLKEWIYKRRTDIRLERDRAERRQAKEEESQRQKAERPALFVF